MLRVLENLVLLHGFAGTRHTWDGVIERLAPKRYTPLALDLPGHGEATSALGVDGGEIAFDACVEHVLAHSPPQFTLCGYSLGGRVALHIALAAPRRVKWLVVVSSTAGILYGAERSARRQADNALADDLEKRPFAEFIERWAAQPVFAGDPPEVHEAVRNEQLRNDPRALAAVLRGIGTGAMEPLLDRLSGLRMPVTLVVGARDTKFHAPTERIFERVPESAHVVVPGGHRLPLENPQAIADVLADTPNDWPV